MAVLSIQSHVVYGYAGNSAAVFPLQRLGHEVWAINTVEFSNHTGYGAWRGKVLGADLVQDLVKGLEERGVLGRCSAVLSGYLGDASVGMAVIDAVKKVKRENPAALYCCDPVMGDIGRGFYVKPDIPAIFKNELIPHADIVCPNQFELEALTGINIDSIEVAIKAIKMLHEMGHSIVLVTSYIEEKDKIAMLSSFYDKSREKPETQIYKITTAQLPLGDNVAGTGDLTTSIFLSRYLETKNPEKTLNLCTSSVYGILEKCYKTCYNNTRGQPVELKIIEAQQELCSPSYSFKAVKI